MRWSRNLHRKSKAKHRSEPKTSKKIMIAHGWKIIHRMMKMEIVDTITAETTTQIMEDKILKNATKNVQDIFQYQIHDQESTQITENVTGMTKIVRHCDVVKEVDVSTQGSENNEKHENHKDSIYRA